MRYKSTLIFIVLFVINLYTLYAQEKMDPDFKWQTITTPHFNIHFHQGLKPAALRMVKIAEEVYYKLVKEIKWEPKWRVDVVLVDNMDMANGFATPFPFNKVQIYISRPEVDQVLNNFDDWLRLVFTHEYTHILNMDSVSGIPWFFRTIFGRNPFFFPNMFSPIWMLEGNALYHESADGIHGRNNSVYADMIMRMEVYSNRFKSIDKACVSPRQWPRGSVPYIYGGKFVEFLENSYGRGKMADVFLETSGNIIPWSDNIYPIPYFYNKDAKDVYDKSFPALWDEFEKYQKLKYNAQIKRIKQEGLSEFNVISDKESNSVMSRFSNDGKHIYYIRHSPYIGSYLMDYNLETGENNKLTRVNYPESIIVGENNKIFISDIEYYASYLLYNETFIYQDGDYDQTSYARRSKDIDVFKNGDRLYIRNEKNHYSLIKADPMNKMILPIIDKAGIQLAHCKISPDNKKIVFVIKDLNGNTDLVLYNLTKKRFLRLTNDKFHNNAPVWHPDGKRIVFSSDRNGVYNLYEYNLQKNQVIRLTNLVGGAFRPDISPDGKKISFTAYQSKGNTISYLAYSKKLYERYNVLPEVLEKSFFYRQKDEQYIDQLAKIVKVEDYNSLKSLVPITWFLWFFQNTEQISPDKYDSEFYLILGGFDPLVKHYYQLIGSYFPRQKKSIIDFSYTCMSFYPDFFIGYYDDGLFWEEDKFPWEDTYERNFKRDLNQIGYIGMLIPLYWINTQHILQGMYIYEKEKTDIYLVSSDSVFRDETIEARIQGIYYFNNAKNYLYSISPEDGMDLLLIGDYYHEDLGSDIAYYKVRGEFNGYLPSFFDNNVLRLRVRGAACRNNDLEQPYTLGRFTKGERDFVSHSEDEWGLKGYPAGSIWGNKLATAALEYKFPLIQADFGLLTFPLMFRDLWINVYGEYGNVWDDGTAKEYKKEDFKRSAGIELHLHFTLGYTLDLSGYVGFSRGYDEYGEDQVYFAVSTIIAEYAGAPKSRNKRLNYFK